MSYVRIPLTNQPFAELSFRVTLDGGARNASITLKLRYFDLYDYWMADVYDTVSGLPLVCGLTLVPGVNLLGQYQHLYIGDAYIVAVTNTDLEQPDNTSLGSTFVLIWGDDS